MSPPPLTEGDKQFLRGTAAGGAIIVFLLAAFVLFNPLMALLYRALDFF